MVRSANVLKPLTARSILGGIERWYDGVITRHDHRKHGIKIGIAVSGGPDSMALAYLLKRIPIEYPQIKIDSCGIIINHNARRNSGKEAEFVKWQLSKLGVDSVVIPLSWPSGINPLDLSDFESQARQMRYRQIAHFALKHQINDIFLGHHQDDQVETLMMRLAKSPNSSFLGLQGMAAECAIPCCEDVYGAYESVNSGTAGSLSCSDESQGPPQTMKTLGQEVGLSQPGGLRLHRPLLHVPKARLISTCEANSVVFVHDETNDDPTLTLRNAVRYLRNNHQLPVALQEQSILRLGRGAQDRLKNVQERGAACVKNLDSLKLDLRSGTIIFQTSQEFSKLCISDKMATANALARISGAVSPQPRDQLLTVAPKATVDWFIDAMMPLEHKSMSTRISETGQAMSQIQNSLLENYAVEVVDDRRHGLWRVSRQPMRKSEVTRNSCLFTASQDNSNNKPEIFGQGTNDGIYSSWIFWDHRYWIRVKAQSLASLNRIGMRPYTVTDAIQAQTILTRQGWQELQDTLADAAPGKIRFTMPILTVDNSIACFPTLNHSVQPCQENGDFPIMGWEIRYKVTEECFVNARTEQPFRAKCNTTTNRLQRSS